MEYFTARRFLQSISVIGVVFLMFGYFMFFSPPNNFPVGQTFVIAEDETLSSISTRLENDGYIHSALLFRTMISFLGKDRHIQLGGFVFERPYQLQELVDKLVLSKPDAPLVKVTIPEGSTLEEIAKIMHSTIPAVSEEVFIAQAKEKRVNGRLFPSTYYLLPSTNEARGIEIMQKTFEKNFQIYFESKEVPKELVSIDEVLSLAAILEGEAKGEKDMQIVAGILLKRLALGMPLQVDVVMDTYKTKGVPKGIINNPGIVAIGAVYSPIETEYLYYITGNDGTMHYAKTFSEHRNNIVKYLK